MSTDPHVPVAVETCGHVPGPFYHGTAAALSPGMLVSPGHPSNYEAGRTANHVYFSALLEPAVWGAELAVALTHADTPGHVYEVEPTGPFEDDPNLTNKRFPGNPTRSFRSKAPLRVVAERADWPRHAPEAVATMAGAVRAAIAAGSAPIED